MKCPSCGFDEAHDGRYCTECGAAYIDVVTPSYLYPHPDENKVCRIEFRVANYLPRSAEEIEISLIGIQSKDGEIREVAEAKLVFESSLESKQTVTVSLVNYPIREPIEAMLTWRMP